MIVGAMFFAIIGVKFVVIVEAKFHVIEESKLSNALQRLSSFLGSVK